MKGTKINIIQIFVFFILSIYPICFTNQYDDLVSAKYIIFMVSSLTMVYFCVLNRVYTCNDIKPFRIICDFIKSLSITDIAVISYFVFNVISVMFSDYKVEALTGSCSNNMGLIFVFVLMLVYFFVSRNKYSRKCVIFSLAVALVIIVAFATIQFLGYDIFNLVATIDDDLQINYLSTLGNTNIYSSYLSLITPVFMTLAVLSDIRRNRIIYYCLSGIGFVGLFTANSDGGYIAFFIAVLFVLFVAVGHKKRVIRFLVLCLSYCGATMFFYCLKMIFSETIRPLSKLTGCMVSLSNTFLCLSIVLFLIAILSHASITDNFHKKLRKYARTFILVLMVSVLAIFVYVNYINPDIEENFFINYFKFSGDWGTGRGYVWSWCVDIFSKGDIVNKLFGHGVGTCGIELLSNYAYDMKYSLGYYFTNAHNEYLEILLNTGITGLVSYILVILTTITKNFKHKDYFGIVFSAGIAAYCGQSFFIVMQPVVIPILFVFIGLANTRIENIY